jgi:competence protein ComEC
MAVRGSDGRLAVHRSGRDAFTVREWLAADGDPRLPADPALGEGFRCDEAGCIARLSNGRVVALVLAPDAFEEDCRRAAVAVSARDAPPQCEALAIDRKASRAQGAISLRLKGDGFEIESARPPGQDRPWAKALPAPAEPASAITRPSARDATPRPEDLQPGD